MATPGTNNDLPPQDELLAAAQQGENLDDDFEFNDDGFDPTAFGLPPADPNEQPIAPKEAQAMVKSFQEPSEECTQAEWDAFVAKDSAIQPTYEDLDRASKELADLESLAQQLEKAIKVEKSLTGVRKAFQKRIAASKAAVKQHGINKDEVLTLIEHEKQILRFIRGMSVSRGRRDNLRPIKPKSYAAEALHSDASDFDESDKEAHGMQIAEDDESIRPKGKKRLTLKLSKPRKSRPATDEERLARMKQDVYNEEQRQQDLKDTQLQRERARLAHADGEVDFEIGKKKRRPKPYLDEYDEDGTFIDYSMDVEAVPSESEEEEEAPILPSDEDDFDDDESSMFDSEDSSKERTSEDEFADVKSEDEEDDDEEPVNEDDEEEELVDDQLEEEEVED